MFITNARRYGPFGGGGGIPFHSPVLSNGSIVSFFANTGRVVDAIGVYVKPNGRGSTKEQVTIDFQLNCFVRLFSDYLIFSEVS
jgi:hypothetical protein